MKPRGDISPQERDEIISNSRPLPSKTSLVKNLTKALVKHVADGLKKVEIDEYVERLRICNTNKCGMRVKNRCTHEDCGCFLDKKAWWASEDCPMNLWPKQ
jgi:hypothetical protein